MRRVFPFVLFLRTNAGCGLTPEALNQQFLLMAQPLIFERQLQWTNFNTEELARLYLMQNLMARSPVPSVLSQLLVIVELFGEMCQNNDSTIEFACATGTR